MQALEQDVSFKGSGLTQKSSVTQPCLRQNPWQERLKSTLTAGEQVCLQGADGMRDHHLHIEMILFKFYSNSNLNLQRWLQNENFGTPARGRHDA